MFFFSDNADMRGIRISEQAKSWKMLLRKRGEKVIRKSSNAIAICFCYDLRPLPCFEPQKVRLCIFRFVPPLRNQKNIPGIRRCPFGCSCLFSARKCLRTTVCIVLTRPRCSQARTKTASALFFWHILFRSCHKPRVPEVVPTSTRKHLIRSARSQPNFWL